MNELKTFENQDFGQVRVVEISNEPWFIGKDVADILGYQNGSRDINTHVDEEDRQNYQNSTLGTNRGMTVINESGLYSLILSSKLPNAKKFKKWVTSEVLPSIRKHGAYIDNQENSTPEEIMAKGLFAAQQIIEEKTKQIEEMTPKALFCDSVSASKDSILVEELAKLITQNGVEIGRNRLFKWFVDNGYLYIRNGYYQPMQRYVEQGLFEIKKTVINKPNGIKTASTVKITGKGQVYFINKILGEKK